MSKTLHIVSFDVPYPANYGGVIDVFYKIIELHKLGFDINLHCFIYGRERSEILNKYCKRVFYYKRKLGIQSFFSGKPYIVKSRISSLLLTRLEGDNTPILYEGIHSTLTLAIILRNNINRKVFIRAHNIEYSYYKELFQIEKNIIKKFFYYFESKKLKNYEINIYKNRNVFGISSIDVKRLKALNSNASLIHPFHSNNKICSNLGSSNYALIHGNFDVLDNELSALFFVNIFTKIDLKLIIAGRNPSKKLKVAVNRNKNIKLIQNPEDDELFSLIKNAHINLFYSLQSSGIKLKLINALFVGRFCYVNENFLVNNSFLNLCTHIKNDNDWENEIVLAFQKTFSKKDLLNRQKELLVFNNIFNANEVKSFF